MKKWMRKDIFIYGIIMILGLSIFYNHFWNADELWNYNFARAALNGLLPYRDFNIVPTPLSIYISALFLKVFGDSLFSYRIAGYALMVITLCLTYKLCKRITMNNLFSFMAVFMLWALNISVYIYNYNNVALVMVLIIMLLEWDGAFGSETRGKHIAIGLCCGIIPLLKQSLGLVMLCAHGLVCLYYVFIEKKDWKQYGGRILLSGVPGLLYLCFLVATNTLMDFIDQAVLGIGTFVYRVTFVEFMMSSPINFAIGFLSIGIVLYGVWDIFFCKKGNRIKYVYTIYAFSWMFIASYPLCDAQHFYVAVVPVIPLGFIYIGERERHKDIFFYVKLLLGTMLFMVVIITAPDMEDYPKNDINHYEGIPMQVSTKENIEEVCKYIQQTRDSGYKVYMAYEYASMYMIPLDSYTKYWDLLMGGNLGTCSIEELLDVDENSIFLVPKVEQPVNKMAVVELMEYIRENYVCIDEVQQFDVYKKDETK